MEPYIETRVYQNWRWNYNTGGGQLLDWIGHHGDIAHWGLGFDLTGPSEIEGHGEFPASNALWNTATAYRIECKYRKEVTGYAGDVSLTIAGGHPAIVHRNKMDRLRTDGSGSTAADSTPPTRIGSSQNPSRRSSARSNSTSQQNIAATSSTQ